MPAVSKSLTRAGNNLTYTFVSPTRTITFSPPQTASTFNLPPGTYTLYITGPGQASSVGYRVTVAPCPLSNTGATNCALVPSGTADPRWRLAQPFPSAISAAALVNPSNPLLTFGNVYANTAHPAWTANSTSSPYSSWITPSAIRQAQSGGQYAYRTTFFSGPQTTLTGRFLSDNHVLGVYLNGVLQTVPSNLTNPFTVWTSFSIPVTPNTVYTLDFVVRNSGVGGIDASPTDTGLRVEFATISCPDLMIRDTPVDTGLEPNPDNGPMWISDDIWVRNIANASDNLCMVNGFMPDGVTRCHQNPKYAGTGFKNKVYVRVTNPNPSGSKTGTVRLYWSKASSGLGWPANWEANTSGGLGGEIVGPTVPTNPVTVPANSSVIVAFDWEPPNPATFGETESHICLLARIELTPTSPFGMTFSEAGSADVNANTRNNARIAWKNVTVVPDIITGGMKPGSVIVRNIEPTQANIRLAFEVSETGDGKTLLDYGAVDVQLGPELFERWIAGGRAGEGVQVLAGNVIRLTSSSASLRNISMGAGETRTISLMISLASRPPATKEGVVDINQYSTVNGQEKVVGGVRYALPLMPTSRIVVTGGNSQTAPVNSPFGTPLQAQVTNAAGSPLGGASVTFVAPTSGPSGTFNGTATVLTDTSGIATAPAFNANGTAGSYAVLATTAGAPSPASIALTNGNRAAALQISKVHAGNFTRGGTGAYTVTVSNAAGAGPTSGPVGVTDTRPTGLTITAMSGTGWTCSIPTCTRTDVLNAGQSYPPIIVSVSVAVNATSPQINVVTVAGGGSALATASDPTVITIPGGTFVPAPSVVGLTQAAATTAIQGVGLVLGTVTTATSATVPAGSVISQNPAAGTQVNTGSTVSLVVSTGSSPTAGLRFVPLTPCRVMETRALYNFEGRIGAFGPPSLAAAETRVLNLPASNVCSIPNTAKAYVVNVTLIPRTTADFATVWPTGDPRPNYWTVRSPDGQIVANSAIVRAGTNSGISIYTSDDADILIDISGYFTEGAGLAFYPMTPCRVIDTRIEYRSPAGPFGPPSMLPGQTRNFRFPQTPYCNVPAATAYSVTLTAVPPGPLAFMTAWPDGGPQPSVSSINSFVGRTLANSIIVPASATGAINVFAFNSTDFLMDINGYFAPDDGQTGQFYFPVTQCRVSDSTVSGGQYPDTSVRTINVPASSCAGVPSNARGYALNFTAIPNGNPMPFLTAYPTGQPQPGASILNAFQGQTVTNSAIIPAGTNGAVDVYAFRRTHVVVEISGYFGR